MTLTETQASALARALSDTVTPAALFGAICQLFQTPITITPNTPLATFTAAVATYSGYASATIAWSTPSLSNEGIVEVLGTMTVFKPTGSTITNGIYGLYITDSGGTDLLFAGQFDNVPISMESTLDKIAVTIRYRPQEKTIVAYID